MISETYFWPIFGSIFVVALCLDLFVFQRKAHIIPIKEALKLVGFWASLAVAFSNIPNSLDIVLSFTFLLFIGY